MSADSRLLAWLEESEDHEAIACEWLVTLDAQPPLGPSGRPDHDYLAKEYSLRAPIERALGIGADRERGGIVGALHLRRGRVLWNWLRRHRGTERV